MTAPLNKPRWWQEPRWKDGRPKITTARAKAIAAKRAWAKFGLPISRCTSGNELVASAVTLADRVKFEQIAPVLPPELARKLRTPHRKAVVAIAAAMVGLGTLGVVATHTELGRVIGLKPRQTGTVLRELVEWKLLTSSPTFTRYGAVSSQRGNAYQLGAPVAAALLVDNSAGRQSHPAPQIANHPERDPVLGSGSERELSEMAGSNSTEQSEAQEATDRNELSLPRSAARRVAWPGSSGRDDRGELVTSADEWLQLLEQLQRGGGS